MACRNALSAKFRPYPKIFEVLKRRELSAFGNQPSAGGGAPSGFFDGRPQDFHRLAFDVTGYRCFTAHLTGLIAERRVLTALAAQI
jgi:hypothetical protein